VFRFRPAGFVETDLTRPRLPSPVSKANLLCLYFSCSHALATAPARHVSFQPHVLLREAHRADVSQIQRCNLATLPENYHAGFYVDHIRKWPQLALVAEYVTRPDSGPVDASAPSSDRSAREIVGYVLGKVQGDDEGHVTSLAVMPDYRGLGLARELMHHLHENLAGQGAKDVDLNVRVSNAAATRLYTGRLGYSVESVVGGYYQDGEDAYLMKRELCRRADDDAAVEEELRDVWEEPVRSARRDGVRRRLFPRAGREAAAAEKKLCLPRTLPMPDAVRAAPQFQRPAEARRPQKVASGAQ